MSRAVIVVAIAAGREPAGGGVAPQRAPVRPRGGRPRAAPRVPHGAGSRVPLRGRRSRCGRATRGRRELLVGGRAWKDLVAGPPRLADDVYSWLRPHVPDDVSFAPTPGQGDSDGGDLF